MPLTPSGWTGPITLPFTHVLLSWKSPFYPSIFDAMISYRSFLFPSKQGARWLSSSEYSWIFLPWFPFDVHSCKREKSRLVYLSSAAWDSWSMLAEYTKDVYRLFLSSLFSDNLTLAHTRHETNISGWLSCLAKLLATPRIKNLGKIHKSVFLKQPK